MHKVICVIVNGRDKSSAFQKAKASVDRFLVGEQKPFDYATPFDRVYDSISGIARWGKLPAVAEIGEPILASRIPPIDEGWKLLQSAIDSSKKELFRNLNEIRKSLGLYTNEDFWEGRARLQGTYSIDMVRLLMYEVGQYFGETGWIFDEFGGMIRNKPELETALKKPEGQRVFIVPFDVHY